MGQEAIKVQSKEAHDHRLGSPAIIQSDVPAEPGHSGVTVVVVVGQDGNVESAKATQGPTELFRQAEVISLRSKFRPFLRNGHPVRVSFEDSIGIVPFLRWLNPKVPFPEIKDRNSLRISLQRSGCYFGTCPGYTVEVMGDGEVEFTGRSNALVMGQHRSQISMEAVESLLTAFRQADYFSALNSYRARVTDQPTFTTTIEFDGLKKSVTDYVGALAGMPAVLHNLESTIDSIVGTEKWLKGNAETVPSLVAEKWDFQADTAENRALFARAIDHGASDLVEAFTNNGALALTITDDGKGPLISAAAKGDLELVMRLLVGHAAPSPAVLSCTLGAAARSGYLSLVHFLLEKGADVNGPPCGRGERLNVLMNAVASGKPEIVQEILAAHTDINAVTNVSGYGVISFFFYRSPMRAYSDEMVKFLLAAGANPDARDNLGQTPAFYACQFGHPEALQLLIAAGADPNAVDKNQRTIAMTCFSLPGLKALIDAGADLTLRDSSGRTVLDMVQQPFLLEKRELIQKALAAKKIQLH